MLPLKKIKKIPNKSIKNHSDFPHLQQAKSKASYQHLIKKHPLFPPQ